MDSRLGDILFYRKEAWQDWAVAECGGKEVKVQVLLFMNIAEDCLYREIESELSCSGEAGKYALVHSTLVETDYADKIVIYGQQYNSFSVFEDSLLVRWNCKVTEQIHRWKSLNYAKTNRKHLKPTISIVSLSQIKQVVVGIPDHKCEIPFGYLFIPAKRDWEHVLMEFVSDFTNHDKMFNEDEASDSLSDDNESQDSINSDSDSTSGSELD